MPRADDLPSFRLEFNGTRCTTNPLGVKGCGEAGAVAMPSTPIRIRMLRGRRGPWAVVSFRFRPKRRSGHRAANRHL